MTEAEILERLTEKQAQTVLWHRAWEATRRTNQVPPDDFTECGFMAGRGFGKTRVGAEWLGRQAYEDKHGYMSAVVAPTYQDIKFTCFEGESGLCNVIPSALIKNYNKTDLVLEIYNHWGGTSEIRGFTAEKPERLRGPQFARAWCFIAGTMVATPDGDVRIEALQPGDMVLTRKGPRRVLVNGRRMAEVGNVIIGDKMLVGTADHPVYLPHGWTRMDRLRVGDQACVISASSGAVSAGTSTGPATMSAPTSPFARSGRSASTVSDGLPRSARSQTAGTSTTGTRTRATTPSTTWTASRTASTSGIMCSSALCPPLIGLRALTSSASAWTATALSRASGLLARLSARVASKFAPTPSASCPSSAGAAASPSSRAPELSAASVVSTWQPTGRQYVYCLAVEGEPEYFANGVLVHNCDELAAWQYADETWDMLQMTLRLGDKPQVVWTTTPKPRDIVRRLIVPKPGRIIITGSTYDNRDNLPTTFFEQLEQYEGTKLGRQELDGELLDPEESGIVKRSDFRLWPADKPLPQLDYIILSLDTAFTEATYDKKTGDADSTACVVLGVFRAKDQTTHVIVLDCWSDQIGMPDLIKRVKKELNVAYGDDQDEALIKPMFGGSKPITSGRKPDLCLIEDKGSGISLRQMLEREGIEAYAYNPGRADKLARLHMVSHVFARHRVWLPESNKHKGRPRNWVEPMLAQLCAFTGSGSIKHDDYVDAVTQCLRVMLDKNLLTMVKAAKQGEADRPPPKIIRNPYAI